jgi:hypothetical protein
MKYIYQVLILAGCSFFITGCSQHYYAPILYNNNASYQPKPLSTDSNKSANYISGGLSFGAGADGFSDYFNMGQINIDRAYTFKHFSLAYGVFGAAGEYSNGTTYASEPNDFENKSFAALGAKLSFALTYPLNDHMDLRLPGLEFSYSKEFGDYLAFRDQVKDRPDYHVNNNNVIFMGGLTSELAWHGYSKLNIHYAVRFYVGTEFDNQDFSNYTDPISGNAHYTPRNVAASFYMEIKRYTFTIERQSIANASVSLGYHF